MFTCRKCWGWWPLLTGITLLGCSQMVVRHGNRDVYRLIEERQQVALGETSDVQLHDDSQAGSEPDRMYDFAPRPVTPELPPEFELPSKAAEVVPSEEDEAADEDAEHEESAALTPSIFTAEENDRVTVMGLSVALRYASNNGRALQDAKEELYLAALDLSLERHLWTPQWVASVSSDVNIADDGEPVVESSTSSSSTTGTAAAVEPRSLITQPVGKDRAYHFLSDVAVSQRLPYGGALTAKVVTDMVRDLKEHVARGESGSLILQADVPLLRGAGRTAYESRFAAERQLIYAVRTYERFRRSFLVEVASEYLDLQQLKAAIANTYQSYDGRREASVKADYIHALGQERSIFDAPRAKSSLRGAEAALVGAKEQYESALDRFKIVIGMPVGQLLDVMDQEKDEKGASLDAMLPDVDRAVAEQAALRYRLDLLNAADAVDDARRGVAVARNAILPDLNFSANWATYSDPDHLNAFTFNPERMTWHAGLMMNMDDRKTERNAYLASLVAIRKAQRDYEQATDDVRADVRRALRRVAQQENIWRIQLLNVQENENRLGAAQAQFELGRSTNQDVVDAENDLLEAKNNLARAKAGYRVAILELRRDSGTLRVESDGSWRSPGEQLGTDDVH